MELSKISDGLQLDIIGDEDIQIFGIGYAVTAKKNDIGIVFDRQEALHSAAKVILTNKFFLAMDKTILLCHSGVLRMAKVIADKLVAYGECYDYGKLESYSWHDGGFLLGENSFIGEGTSIGALSTIGSNVHIGSRCRIGESVYIGAGTIIGDNVTIRPGAKIASPAFFMYDRHTANDFVGFGRVKIGNNVSVGTNSIIQRGTFADTVIDDDTGVGDSVVIGHDVRIGKKCRIVSQSGIAGRTVLDNNVEVLGQVGIAEKIYIGEGATIKAKSLVSKNIASHEVISGLYGRRHIDEMRLQAKLRRKF